MNFALLVEKLSEEDYDKASVRKGLSEQLVPEMQKALNDLKKKTAVNGRRRCNIGELFILFPGSKRKNHLQFLHFHHYHYHVPRSHLLMMHIIS